MPWVLLLVIGLIAYGSLHPFEFAAGFSRTSLGELIELMAVRQTSRGDILQNLILFAPFGACALLSLPMRWPSGVRVALVAGFGLALAFGLQVGQVFLPQRHASLIDVAWNGAGIGFGIAAGFLGRRMARPADAHEPGRLRAAIGADLVPVGLAGLWLAVRLSPFLPSLDLQLIKDNLKPLLLRPDVTMLGLAENTIGWLAMLAFLQRTLPAGQTERGLYCLMAGVLAVQPAIVHNPLRAHEVLGALLAVAIWRGWLAGRTQPAAALAWPLLGLLVLQGLWPLALRAEPAAFGWVPFAGALDGSILANSLAMTGKAFFYGTAVWVLAARGIPLIVGTLTVAGLLASVEFCQTLLAGRTPEIADPLLAILLGIAFALIGPPRRDAVRAPTGASGGSRLVRPAGESGTRRPRQPAS